MYVNGSRQAKKCLRVCAKYADSRHPAHSQSLSRAFALLKHSILSNESFCGQRRPWSDCADAQADLRLRCPHIPKDTLAHGIIHIVSCVYGICSSYTFSLILSCDRKRNIFFRGIHSSWYMSLSMAHTCSIMWKHVQDRPMLFCTYYDKITHGRINVFA